MTASTAMKSPIYGESLEEGRPPQKSHYPFLQAVAADGADIYINIRLSCRLLQLLPNERIKWPIAVPMERPITIPFLCSFPICCCCSSVSG